MTDITFQAPQQADPWVGLVALSRGHGRTKTDNNTYLQRDTDETGDHLLYSIVLHDTAILTFDPVRRTVVLDSGGYRTRLTQRRTNQYLQPFGYEVVSHSGLWVVQRLLEPASGLLYVDGMVVDL